MVFLHFIPLYYTRFPTKNQPPYDKNFGEITKIFT